MGMIAILPWLNTALFKMPMDRQCSLFMSLVFSLAFVIMSLHGILQANINIQNVSLHHCWSRSESWYELLIRSKCLTLQIAFMLPDPLCLMGFCKRDYDQCLYVTGILVVTGGIAPWHDGHCFGISRGMAGLVRGFRTMIFCLFNRLLPL